MTVSPPGIADDNASLLQAGGFGLVGSGGWQAVPLPPPAVLIRCPAAPPPSDTAGVPIGEPPRRLYPVTEICVAESDTLSAALTLGDAVALAIADTVDRPDVLHQCGR